jgi:glycosyltransferase involved in cell wall biosynthesis
MTREKPLPLLCLITTCKGRLAHLQQSLPAAAAQPSSSCLVVDYSCPESCGDWVERHYPAVQVVRVPGQPGFNISQARNVGAAAANAPWLCFFDADVVLSPQFVESILPGLTEGRFYVAQPRKQGLTGTMVCSRSDFAQVGGYDEVYAGWGDEDVDLYDHFLMRGLKQGSFPQHLLGLIEHGDDLRLRFQAVPLLPISHARNMLYRLAKFDLMRLLGRELSEPERRGLHAEASQSVQASMENLQETQWRIQFRQLVSPLGQDIHATLVYSLGPPRQGPTSAIPIP